jgi:hypothetical protein
MKTEKTGGKLWKGQGPPTAVKLLLLLVMLIASDMTKLNIIVIWNVTP